MSRVYVSKILAGTPAILNAANSAQVNARVNFSVEDELALAVTFGDEPDLPPGQVVEFKRKSAFFKPNEPRRKVIHNDKAFLERVLRNAALSERDAFELIEEIADLYVLSGMEL